MIDFTKGNVTKNILMFTIPILLSNIFQQFYNIADFFIINKVMGVDGLASIGSVSTAYNLLICFVSNTILGFSIKISKSYGAKDYQNTLNYIINTIILSLFVGIILTVVSLMIYKKLLISLNTPLSILKISSNYFIILIIGLIFATTYNMFSHIFRALGNTKISLYIIIISSILNVLLDFILVVILKKGICGAAFATIFSQFTSSLMSFLYFLFKYKYFFSLKNSNYKVSNTIFDQLKMGFTMGFTSSIVFLGTLSLQGSVNSLGTDVIAGHSFARQISEIYMQPLSSISSSVTILTSQNIGAKNIIRIKKGINKCFKISYIWCFFIIYITFFHMNIISTIFGIKINSSTYLIAFSYLKLNTLFYFALSGLFILRNLLIGFENKIIPSLSSCTEFIIKIIIAYFLVKKIGYNAIIICEPITWILSTFWILIYLLSHKKLLIS